MDIISKEITQDNIIDSCNQFLNTHSIQSSKDRLPFLYWTAKMHKNPTSHRYITSGVDTVLSELSINVTHCLKLLLKSARNSRKYKFSGQQGINNISIIDNHEKVINFMNTCNKSKSKKTVKPYDFSTLYTSIPHNKLKNKLSEFISKMFDFRAKKVQYNQRKNGLTFSTRHALIFYPLLLKTLLSG